MKIGGGMASKYIFTKMWDNFKWVIVGFYELLRLVVFQCMFYYRFLPILSGGM
jgi:hypothetical protein